jgi:hypothetical protein
MVFNATFNNISVILWRSVLLVEQPGVHEENHRPMHLNDYKFSIQTQELNCLFNFFKFCAIKYIWKSLIHGYFFLKEFHSEILHNYVISTQTIKDNC